MGERMSWEEYRRAHDISDQEEGEAFAAYLHYLSGGTWDGEAPKVEGPAEPDRPGVDGHEHGVDDKHEHRVDESEPEEQRRSR